MQNTFDSGTAESKMGELNKSQQQQLLFHLQEVAKIHTLHGQFEVAAQLYRDMLTVSPHSTDFNLAAAHCYFQLNRLFLAMNFYQIADECSPKSDRQQYDINVCLGLTYKGLQKFEQAQKQLESALKYCEISQEHSLKIQYQLALIQVRMGEHSEAVQCFQMIAAQETLEREKRSDSMLKAGILANVNGEHDRAFELYSQAALLQPGGQLPILHIALWKIQRGQYQEGLDIVKQLTNQIADASYIRSLAYLGLNNDEKALIYVRQAVDQDPQNLIFLMKRATLALKLGFEFECLEALLRASEVGPLRWEIQFNLAIYYELNLKYELAQHHYLQTASLNPTNSVAAAKIQQMIQKEMGQVPSPIEFIYAVPNSIYAELNM